MARIRHLAIVSENRERLVKFYTEAFGMKVIDGVGPAIYCPPLGGLKPSPLGDSFSTFRSQYDNVWG